MAHTQQANACGKRHNLPPNLQITKGGENVNIYRIRIQADRYPTEYTVQATGWPTAVARAIKEWKKRFKGSRTTEMSIKAIKGGPLLQENEQ